MPPTIPISTASSSPGQNPPSGENPPSFGIRPRGWATSAFTDTWERNDEKNPVPFSLSKSSPRERIPTNRSSKRPGGSTSPANQCPTTNSTSFPPKPVPPRMPCLSKNTIMAEWPSGETPSGWRRTTMETPREECSPPRGRPARTEITPAPAGWRCTARWTAKNAELW